MHRTLVNWMVEVVVVVMEEEEASESIATVRVRAVLQMCFLLQMSFKGRQRGGIPPSSVAFFSRWHAASSHASVMCIC